MASPSKVIVVDLSSAENHAQAATLMATALAAEAASLEAVNTYVDFTNFKGQRALAAFISLSPKNATTSQSSRVVTAADTVLAADELIIVDATAGAFALTLPPAASVSGRVFTVKKIDAVAAVALTGDGAELIDGNNVSSMASQYDALAVYSDGTVWHIIN